MKSIFVFKEQKLEKSKIKVYNFLQESIYPGITIDYIETCKNKIGENTNQIIVCLKTVEIDIYDITDEVFATRFRNKLIDILRDDTPSGQYIRIPKKLEYVAIPELMEIILKKRYAVEHVKQSYIKELEIAYNTLNEYMLSQIYMNYNIPKRKRKK